MKKALIIDDDNSLSQMIEAALQQEQFECVRTPSGLRALREYSYQSPHLVILDWNLPDTTGLELCQQFRTQSNLSKMKDPFILMITSRASNQDRLAAYCTGVDDFIMKPFDLYELVIRVRTLMRRDNQSSLQGLLQIIETKHFLINPVTRNVLFNPPDNLSTQVSLELSANEFNLLHYLASKPGRVHTTESLLDHLKGEDFIGDKDAVTSYICKMRKALDKIAPKSGKLFLQTSWGIGYKFEDLPAIRCEAESEPLKTF